MPQANVVMRKVVLTSEYQPLSQNHEVVSVEISAMPCNAANAFFKGDTGDDVPWIPGEFHSFRNVDLSSIQAKGTPGDVVTVIGGSW